MSHSTQVSTSKVLHNLYTKTLSSARISIVSHILTTNNLVSSLTSTFAWFNNRFSTFSFIFNTSSKTLSIAFIQIISSISTTYRLSDLRTLAFSKKIRIINFNRFTKSVMLFSKISTFHHTLVSITLIINTTNWYISLMAFAISL